MRDSEERAAVRISFRGDISTAQGLMRIADRVLREFAAGVIGERRYNALLRGVRTLAMLRRSFAAPPVDEPAEQDDLAHPRLTVEADRRPTAERAEEIRTLTRSPFPARRPPAAERGEEIRLAAERRPAVADSQADAKPKAERASSGYGELAILSRHRNGSSDRSGGRPRPRRRLRIRPSLPRRPGESGER